MMKTASLVVIFALCTTGCAQVAAGLLEGDRKQEEQEAPKSSAQKVADAMAAPAGPKLASEKRASLLQCADISRSDLVVGKDANYKYTQGMNSTQTSGLIQRRDASLEDGCFVQLNAGECLSMQVDQATYDKMGGSWQVQCIESAAPEKGMVEYSTVSPNPNLNRLTGTHMILKCGHDQGDAYRCSEGSNNERAGEFSKELKEKGKKHVSMCATFPESNDPPEYVNKHIYCQYYNTGTKKSLFAFEFLRNK